MVDVVFAEEFYFIHKIVITVKLVEAAKETCDMADYIIYLAMLNSQY